MAEDDQARQWVERVTWAPDQTGFDEKKKYQTAPGTCTEPFGVVNLQLGPASTSSGGRVSLPFLPSNQQCSN